VRRNDKFITKGTLFDLWRNILSGYFHFKASQIPSGGIEINLEVPSHQRKKKKGFDVEAYLKREMAKVQREIQVRFVVQLTCKFLIQKQSWDPFKGLQFSLAVSKIFFKKSLLIKGGTNFKYNDFFAHRSKFYNFDIFLIFNFQMSVHQVHILCLVAHLRHLNRYTTPYPRVGHSSTGTPCSIFPHICFASVKNTDRPTMLRFIQKRNLVKGFSKLNCNIILYIHRTKQD